MNATHKQRLDERISQLERRLENLRMLRTALEDASLAGDIAELFSESSSPQRDPVASRRSGGKTIEKIVHFLESRNNEWATALEIAEGTGVSKHTVRQVVYKTAKDRFDRWSEPGFHRETKFRLLRPPGRLLAYREQDRQT